MTWPSDSQIAQFQRDGAICVRGALDADEIAVVRDVVARMLADPGPYGQTVSRPGAPEFSRTSAIGNGIRSCWS